MLKKEDIDPVFWTAARRTPRPKPETSSGDLWGGGAMSIPALLLIANNALLLLAICFYMYERIAGRYWPALPRLAKTVVLFTAANILIVLSAKVFV